MKKILPVLVMAVVLVSMCVSAPTEPDQAPATQPPAPSVTPTPAAPPAPVAISTVTLDREMTIPDCSVRNLEGKVVIITGPGCAGCPRTITQMETIEKDLGKTFVFLDTAEDASAISDMGIATEFLPVILFDCEAYLGEKSDLFLKTQAEAV